MGVRKGHVAEGYRLVGHRQVREGTDCPGNALYEEIKKWPHYDSAPNRIWNGKKAVPPIEDNKLYKRTVPTVTLLH